ncbi:hypothetical protein [Ralstonia phage RP31]|uniref:Uncharacterized protein n=2 Tax=Ripduovirus RP12 TaxID=2560700 RepID=A0A1L7N0W6_9CAUD|nr:hypothetical protein FDH28_gp273 [Ralstonia phage RP12]BAW19122.1 hypothetical protein [Ralstonia phage RP12]BAW19408.1 hypothetical protein [Ralstonia phage RP31]
MIKFKTLRRGLGMNVVDIDGTLYIDGSPYNPTTLAPLGDNYRQGPSAPLPYSGTTPDGGPGWYMALPRVIYSATPNAMFIAAASDAGGGCSDYMNAGLLANGTPNYVPPQPGENFVVVAGGGGLGARNGMFKRDRATMDALASYASWTGSLDQYNAISSWLPAVSGSYINILQAMGFGSSQVTNAAADFNTANSPLMGSFSGQSHGRTITGILGSFAVLYSNKQWQTATDAATVAVINRQAKTLTTLSAAITGAASVDHCGAVPSHIINETSARGYFFVAESTAGSDNISVSTITVDTIPTTPTATLAACTYDWTGNGGVSAFPALSRAQPSARKIRASIIDRTSTTGKVYLLVTITEAPASTLEAQASHVGVLFEITSKSTLKFVQKFSIADNARAYHTMFTSDAHDRLVVRQADRIAIYKFNDATLFQKVSEYAGQFIAIGVDSQERIWMIEGSSGNQSGNGAVLYYINPENLPNSVSVTFDNSIYTFSGAAINTNAHVNIWNSSGVRIAQNLNLAITSGNATFAGGATTTSVTTSTTGDTLVPISINGIGDVVVEAST